MLFRISKSNVNGDCFNEVAYFEEYRILSSRCAVCRRETRHLTTAITTQLRLESFCR